jgi:type VI secretion system protein ImpA
MIELRKDILLPIPGDNPSGIDLRRDTALLIHDKIKEARRQDDGLSQGEWKTERKTANFQLVVKLAQDTLATVSKDLQLAAWLTEALLAVEGYSGLRKGLSLTESLLTEFWDTVNPPVIIDRDDDDDEPAEGAEVKVTLDYGLRAKPLNWIGSMLSDQIRSAPLVNAGYSWYAYKDSRIVGYEDSARTDKERKARTKMIDEGKIPAELFDKAFAETPRQFYAQAEADLDASLEIAGKLGVFCDRKFKDEPPSFIKLKSDITEVRQTIHGFLQKKREKEPDPVEAVAAAEPAPAAEPGEQPRAAVAAQALGEGAAMAAEPADRRQAIASIAAAAAFLRKREPHSPAPYLLLRGLRWGELRAGGLGDSTLLEAPATELRQQIKRLALAKKWIELLEAGEQAMAQPSSRAWLDLQRLSVLACTGLGDDYRQIAMAIQTELRALLTDLPDLLNATLLDDTPVANSETRLWLQGLVAPAPVRAPDNGEAIAALQDAGNGTTVWLMQAEDPFVLAKEALAAKQEEKAFAIMRAEIRCQRFGRNRFRRTMQLVELAMSAGKDAIAQPLLEDLAAMIETHKLEAWEDPEIVAGDLLKLLRFSKKIQGNSGEKQKLFERICRLDPVQALRAG